MQMGLQHLGSKIKMLSCGEPEINEEKKLNVKMAAFGDEGDI